MCLNKIECTVTLGKQNHLCVFTFGPTHRFILNKHRMNGNGKKMT